MTAPRHIRTAVARDPLNDRKRPNGHDMPRASTEHTRATAAAWLEASDLPPENFEKADKVIVSLLKEQVGGTEPGNYQILKCSLIANSDAIRLLNVQK